VGTQNLSWWAVLMLAYVAGTDSGLGINTGHELRQCVDISGHFPS
jgi:alkane 1-monooxygenase